MLKKIPSDVKLILGEILIWRILLVIVGFFGFNKFPIVQDFYHDSLGPNFFKAWANWDGGHYIGIAEHGYKHIFQYAFFPLYPILIKIFSLFTFNNLFLSAYIVSFLSLIGASLALFYLVKQKFDEQVGLRTVIFLLIFPTSFFLVSAYTESLFLLLSISAFLMAAKKKWFLAALLAFFATAAKFIGIFLVICLIIEYFSQINNSFKKVKKDVLFLLLSPLGLIVYMLFLFEKVGDPLFFMHTQTYWHRSTQIINPLSLLWDKTLVFFSTANFPLNIFLDTDYLYTIIFLISSILIFKKISKSMGVFTFLITIFPLLSGTLNSMPRYVLSAFPFFILLGIWTENRLGNWGVTVFSLFFLGSFTILFLNGNWVG